MNFLLIFFMRISFIYSPYAMMIIIANENLNPLVVPLHYEVRKISKGSNLSCVIIDFGLG